MTISTEKSAQHINVYFAGKAADFSDPGERAFLKYLQQVITTKVKGFKNPYKLKFRRIAYDENRDAQTAMVAPISANAINIVISDHLEDDNVQKGDDKYKSLLAALKYRLGPIGKFFQVMLKSGFQMNGDFKRGNVANTINKPQYKEDLPQVIIPSQYKQSLPEIIDNFFNKINRALAGSKAKGSELIPLVELCNQKNLIARLEEVGVQTMFEEFLQHLPAHIANQDLKSASGRNERLCLKFIQNGKPPAWTHTNQVTVLREALELIKKDHLKKKSLGYWLSLNMQKVYDALLLNSGDNNTGRELTPRQHKNRRSEQYRKYREIIQIADAAYVDQKPFTTVDLFYLIYNSPELADERIDYQALSNLGGQTLGLFSQKPDGRSGDHAPLHEMEKGVIAKGNSNMTDRELIYLYVERIGRVPTLPKLQKIRNMISLREQATSKTSASSS